MGCGSTTKCIAPVGDVLDEIFDDEDPMVVDTPASTDLIKKVTKWRNADLAERVDFVLSLDLFQKLPQEHLVQVAINLHPVRYHPGAALLQGDVKNAMFIILNGSRHISGTLLTTGDCFGLNAPLEEVDPDGIVVSKLECLVMARSDFTLLEMNKYFGGNQGKASVWWHKAEEFAVNGQREYIAQEDLESVGLLGCGRFAAVYLFKHTPSEDCYAFKKLSKGYVVKMAEQDSIFNERRTQIAMSSPFIVKLYETYNTPEALVFLLEPCLGGELYGTLERLGFHGSADHARFYAATVVLALEHMHERHVVSRAITPEDIVLDERGYAKMRDFGLSKFIVERTFTTCGTLEYFAPEVILSKGHSFSVDWWSVGIFIFELLAGNSPFAAAYPMQIYAKVVKGINQVVFPPNCRTGGVEHLIKGLLQAEPSIRLAMRAGGTKNVKEQKWYAGYDWNAHAHLTMQPPYQPVVSTSEPLANFSPSEADIPRMLDYVDPGDGWDADFATASSGMKLRKSGGVHQTHWVVKGDSKGAKGASKQKQTKSDSPNLGEESNPNLEDNNVACNNVSQTSDDLLTDV